MRLLREGVHVLSRSHCPLGHLARHIQERPRPRNFLHHVNRVLNTAPRSGRNSLNQHVEIGQRPGNVPFLPLLDDVVDGDDVYGLPIREHLPQGPEPDPMPLGGKIFFVDLLKAAGHDVAGWRL